MNPLFVFPALAILLAAMQGPLMPAIRRTPPGAEAKRQGFALHVIGTAAYLLPLALAPTWPAVLAALAARLALFDIVLNLTAGRPAFEVGRTALTDKLLRKLAPNRPELLSAALRVVAGLALVAVGVWVAG